MTRPAEEQPPEALLAEMLTTGSQGPFRSDRVMGRGGQWSEFLWGWSWACFDAVSSKVATLASNFNRCSSKADPIDASSRNAGGPVLEQLPSIAELGTKPKRRPWSAKAWGSLPRTGGLLQRKMFLRELQSILRIVGPYLGWTWHST